MCTDAHNTESMVNGNGVTASVGGDAVVISAVAVVVIEIVADAVVSAAVGAAAAVVA